jgi:hypothetical protein
MSQMMTVDCPELCPTSVPLTSEAFDGLCMSINCLVGVSQTSFRVTAMHSLLLQVRILRLSCLRNNVELEERARGGGGEVWKYDRAER